ncbi:hypothetical protein EDD18DRAFT_1107197 [Armillaria luteobubalina]|uniref:Uncharacterized protein n=1 Tax=Armillaria luteobubalina TaxID=153913 RepID=A0AA39ULV7_9AGAR|nr:hypothetical protein EDD18DRAFT_1107197 [Armillaria luteobubalina]
MSLAGLPLLLLLKLTIAALTAGDTTWLAQSSVNEASTSIVSNPPNQSLPPQAEIPPSIVQVILALLGPRASVHLSISVLHTEALGLRVPISTTAQVESDLPVAMSNDQNVGTRGWSGVCGGGLDEDLEECTSTHGTFCSTTPMFRLEASYILAIELVHGTQSYHRILIHRTWQLVAHGGSSVEGHAEGGLLTVQMEGWRAVWLCRGGDGGGSRREWRSTGSRRGGDGHVAVWEGDSGWRS